MKRIACACLIAFTFGGCVSTSKFQAWDGPSEYEGVGGAFTNVDGIDLYTTGTPRRKFQVIGLIDATTLSSGEMMTVFGQRWSQAALVKQAKKKQGDAIILFYGADNIIGYSTTGSAHAHGNAFHVQAHGQSSTSATVARQNRAVLVRYLD